MRVLIDRRVVQNLGDLSVQVTDGERVVSDLTLEEYLFVPLACFFRLCEILREVSADQVGAGFSGNPLGCNIDVSDLAQRVDRDQRIDACLDQTSSVAR